MPPKPAPRRSLPPKDGTSPGYQPTPKPRSRTNVIEERTEQSEELPVKLFVRNLPGNCSEDLLINFFESKRFRKQGELPDVERVDYKPKKDEAIVVFKNNQDLQTVLEVHEKTPCVLSKVEIEVEVYREPREEPARIPEPEAEETEETRDEEDNQDMDRAEEKTRTLFIRGFDANKSTDSLLYYLENHNRSGGGEVEDLTPDRENGFILVTFVDEKDMVAVINKGQTKPHVVEGCRLSIKPFVYSKTDLLFTNIPDNVSEESLKNFLEARLRLDVSDVPFAYNTGKDRAVVKFAETVDLAKATKVCKERPIEGSYLVPMPVSITSTVLVTHLPDSISEDTCRYYFENERKSGGGEIDELDLQSADKYCLITFKETPVVQSVCLNDRHKLMGSFVRVTPYHICLGKPSKLDSKQSWKIPDDDDTAMQQASKSKARKSVDPKKTYRQTTEDTSKRERSREMPEERTKTIFIRGFDVKNKSTDSLLYYLENHNRSGGGDVESLTPDKENGFILVTFVDEKFVESVINKAKTKPHVVEGCRLSIKPFVYSKTDLLFTNIPDKVSEESLKNFLEARLRLDVSDVPFAYNTGKDRAVVKFAETVDLAKAQRICKQRPIEGSYLIPMPVSITSTILVTNLPDESVSTDTCQFYFENSRKTGGGEIEDIDLQSDEGYCLITFKDTAVVESVCERGNHTLLEAVLKVTPYHICLGKPMAPESNQPWAVPEPVITERNHEFKLKFLNSVTTRKTSVDTSFQMLYAIVSWKRKPVVIECNLSKEVKGYRKLGKSWRDQVLNELGRIMANLRERKFPANEEMFPLVMEELQSVNMSHPDEVAVFIERKGNTVVLVATQHAFPESETNIESSFNKVSKELARQKEKTHETKAFEQWQIRYLEIKKLYKDVQTNYPNVKVKLDANECLLELNGPRFEVNDVILMAYEKLQAVQERKVKLPEEAIEILGNETTQQKISDQMRKRDFLDLWEIKKDSVTVYIEEEEDFSKKKMIFKNFYSMLEFDIDASSEIVVRDEKWSELEQALNRNPKFDRCFVIKKIRNRIKIWARTDVKSDIQSHFQSFLSKNSITREEINVQKYVLQFVQRYMDRELDGGMREIQKATEVKLEYKKADLVLLVGTTDGLRDAKRLLLELTERVKFKQQMLKKPGIRQYLTSMKGQESLKSVETNIPCIIHMAEVHGTQAKAANPNQTLKMLGLTQDCAEATLPSGQRIKVYGGNMLQLKVDVIVNAGNEEMKHTGGLAAAIIKAGGESIQKECSKHVDKHGSVPVGEVIVSRAGNLTCKHIVHAVGPRWTGGNNQEPELLEKAIENCLFEADNLKSASIALPALCTGAYRYPVDKACVLIVTTVHQFFQNQSNSSIRDIYLCDINPKTVNEFMKALSSIVGIKQVPHQNGSPVAQRRSEDKNQGGIDVVFGSTQVEVVKGTITTEQVDVIINSASGDLNLVNGKASQALLKAGGQSIQDECKTNYPKGISVGDVAVTNGGKLNCRNIFHICLDPYKRNKSVESLKACINNCLVEADKVGAQSIAFPALGTGAQGFPADVAAQTMFTSVSNYCQTQMGQTTLQTVKFVVFHLDTKIYQAFETVSGQHTQAGVHPSPAPPSTGNASANAGTTDISQVDKKLIKSTKDSAELQIGDVHVNIIQGDITEQDTTAVVASTDSGLDLKSTGQVTKALLAKGGQEFEQDCYKQRPHMQSNGIAVTTGGQLKCKHVIFVCAPHEANKWEDVVYQCLQTAEGHAMTSVSFPVLGTVMGHDPGQIATLMYLAMCRFVADRKTSKAIQEIRIVVFQTSMLDAVMNGFKTSLQGQSMLSQLGQMLFGKKKKQDKTGSDGKDVKNVADSLKDIPVRDSVFQSTVSDVESNACCLTIYAASDKKISDAFQRLDTLVKEEWYIAKVDDPSVLKLDDKQLENIKRSAKENKVEIMIDQDVGEITVQGLIGNVMPVKDLIHEELRAFERGAHQKRHAELLTNVVKWFWIDGSTSTPFEDVHNLKIEDAYTNKEAKITLTDTKMNEDFNVDLQNMQMHYVEQPRDIFTVLRRDIIADINSSDIPSSWDPMATDENLKMVKLLDSSQEYKDVVAELTNTLGKTPNIVEIQRIQNKTLYTQYAAKRRLMKTNNPNIKNEYVLWHGTSVDAVASITAHGYNRSYCGKNAVKFGDGVYFAVNASYSDRNGYARPEPGTGHKRMYRALVLVGEYAQGVEGMRVPPIRGVKGNPDTLYDSVTNNMQSPAMFVIFHDTQAYPEHIITYT